MLKPHATTYKKCFTTLLFVLFYVGLLPPNLCGQVKIKERVELTPNKGIESFIWPVNGCEYDRFVTDQLYVKFEPDHISSGNSTIVSLWLDENYTWPYGEDSEPSLLRTITLDPDYGEWVRIGEGLYRISVPDTVTSDSVAVVFSYTNYEQGCSGQADNEKKSQITDCIDCGLLLWRTLFENTVIDSFVIKPDSFVVYIDPAEVYPGDTVQVVIKKRNADGTLADFPPEQTYEIAKLEGCMLGNILADNDSGSYFYDVSQPIYFAAADSLVGDTTGTVLLQVGLVDNSKKLSIENKPINIESNDCFYGSFVSESFMRKEFLVGPVIKLISYANGLNTLTINGIPSMPSFPIQLKITNDTEGGFLRYWLFMEWKNTQQTGQPVFGAGVTKLIQIQPEDLPIIDFNIDWNFYNEYVICGGNDLTLRIDYKGVIKDFKLITDILGEEPGKSNVEIYLATLLTEPKLKQMKVIIFKESSWHQFNANGYPLFKPHPYDWGLCQLSKPDPTFREIWNWKENVNSGVAHLNLCYSEANRFYLDQKKKFPDANFYSDDELLKQTGQNYKGWWFYSAWVPTNPKTGKPGHWRENSVKAWRKYGEDFWYKYTHNEY